MHANLFLAQQRTIEIRREADRRARSGRPAPARRTLRDRLRGDQGC